MRNIGDGVKETSTVEKILRYLTPKFDSKVFVIEEMQDLRNLTLEQLYGILTTFETRKEGSLNIREVAFKATSKGK